MRDVRHLSAQISPNGVSIRKALDRRPRSVNNAAALSDLDKTGKLIKAPLMNPSNVYRLG